MRFEQRLRKLEEIAQIRLAAAAASAAVCIEEEPPLTEEEARRLDPRELLQLIRAELKPPTLGDSEEFRRHFAHFRRLGLAELWRLYPGLKRRQRELEAQRANERGKGSLEYLFFLRNLYGELATRANRASRRDPSLRDPSIRDPSPEERDSPPERSEENCGPAKEPWRLAWAM